MKTYTFIFVIVFAGLFSCNSKSEKKPTTALDTGRAFIDASLKGDFENAQTLLLKDTENIQLFEAFKLYYQKMPADQKLHYKTASYQINKYLDLNDSTTIINYSNDYMNKPMEIKVVRKNNTWNIDFAYTYSGNLPIQ